MNTKYHTLAHSENSRIVALDYLRVFAVIVLFFFHLGMIWVPEWHFHFKQETHWFGLQHIMLLSSPWRMGLLWFVAGTSLYVMQQKYGVYFLITRRSNAILLPLLIGVYGIVPIQLFVEMTQKGAIDTSLGQFFIQFYFGANDYFEGFSSGIWHHVDVNHLWFLRSLWRFTLLLVILNRPLAWIRGRWGNFNSAWLVLLVSLSLFASQIEDSDDKRDLYGLACLVWGYLFGSRAQFWGWLNDKRSALVVFAIVLTLLYEVGFGIGRYYPDNLLIKDTALWSYYLAKVISLFAILALANMLFVTPHPAVTKANAYIFPFYVIHQSVIIAVGYGITNWAMPAHKAILVCAILSALICVALLLLCKYSDVAGALLGKKAKEPHWLTGKVAQIAIALITLPLAFKLIGLI
tara:strand:- start:4948 stop:6165 length:1218 start_codon:yes stop_codon:yes gene_type:complete